MTPRPILIRLWALLCLIFLAGAGTGILVWRFLGGPEEVPPAAAATTRQLTKQERAQQALRRIDQALNLSRPQRQQARTVLAKWSDEISQQPNLGALERVNLIEKHSDPLRALLTPEQKTAYEAILADLRKQANSQP
jgi:hypothetical protein